MEENSKDIERSEFLSKCFFANFAYFDARDLERHFGSNLSEQMQRVNLGEKDFLLVYDLGNGYGKDLMTGIVLPLLKTNDNESNIKVGSSEALVVFDAKVAIDFFSKISEARIYLYNALKKSPKRKDAIQELYEKAKTSATKSYDEFKSELSVAYICSPDTIDPVHLIYDVKSINENYSFKKHGRPVLIRFTDLSHLYGAEIITKEIRLVMDSIDNKPAGQSIIRKNPSFFKLASHENDEKFAYIFSETISPESYVKNYDMQQITSSFELAKKRGLETLNKSKEEMTETINDYIDVFLKDVQEYTLSAEGKLQGE